VYADIILKLKIETCKVPNIKDDTQTGRWVGRRVDGWMDREIDMDGWMDRQIYR
jgi:hypothetical protein